MRFAPFVLLLLLVVGTGFVGRAGIATAEEAIPDAKADALGKQVQSIVSGMKLDALGPLFDTEAFLDRTFAGLDAPAAARNAVRSGVSPGAWFEPVLPILRQGTPYQYLGRRVVSGQPCLFFRLAGTAGLLYHGWSMQSAPDGSIQLVDMYNYSSAFWISESMRLSMLNMAPEMDPRAGTQRRIYAQDVQRLQQAWSTGRYDVGEQIYKTLPPLLKEDRWLMQLRVQAALQLDMKLYEAALDDYRKVHPNDRSIAFKELDRALLSGRFADALKAIDEVERYLGGDPYLNVTRAIPLMELGRWDEAARRLDTYMKTEPAAPEVLIPRALAALGMKEFDAAVMWLRKWEQATGASALALIDATLPNYEAFVASAAYRRWKSGAAASPTIPTAGSGGTPDAFAGSALELAQAVELELKEHRTDVLVKVFDADRFLDRMAVGLRIDPARRARLKKSMLTPPNSLLGSFMPMLFKEPGIRFKLLGMRTIDGEQCALFRAAGHGLTFYMALAIRSPAPGTVVVYDMHNYVLGQWMSAIMHWDYLQHDPDADPATASEHRAFAKAYDQLMTAWQEGRYADGMRIYEKLPPSYRNRRSLMEHRLYAGRIAGLQFYKEALAALLQRFPSDVGGLLKSIEYRMARGELSEATAAVNGLDRIIGGDPFLDVWRARILVRGGEADKALALVQAFMRKEGKTLSDAWIVLGDCAVTQGDFKAAVPNYQRAETLRSGNPVVVWKRLANYAAFVKSKPYRRWMAVRAFDDPSKNK